MVGFEVFAPGGAKGRELRIGGEPIREVVFGEDGQVGAGCGGRFYKGGGLLEVVFGVERLEGGLMVGMEKGGKEAYFGIELDQSDLVLWCHWGIFY